MLSVQRETFWTDFLNSFYYMIEIWLAVVIAVVATIIGVSISYNYLRSSYSDKLFSEHEKSASLGEEVARQEAKVAGLVSLREKEEQIYKKSLEDLKEANAKAIEATKTQLALENEKLLKEREESLKKEAEQTMKTITSGLDKEIKTMKEAFEAQKKAHSEDSTSIKTKFEETVKSIQEESRRIGTTASDLTNALKGKNKMQGIFGETVLENILRAEGLTKGKDYDTEFYIRDKKGNIVKNEETDKRMRPDFVLHFPDDTDVILDSKVSLTALADYFEADDDVSRAEASRRNLESVLSHIKELTSKEYQKYLEGRKTLDFVIMFIPNYGAYQLAKQENPDIFAEAFRQNVLITTDETLLPFVRLIRSAWVQKAQLDNMAEIVNAARRMVDRVALFCDENVKLGNALNNAVKVYNENTKRLTDGQSILKAARDVSSLGVRPTSRELPQMDVSDEIIEL